MCVCGQWAQVWCATPSHKNEKRPEADAKGGRSERSSMMPASVSWTPGTHAGYRLLTPCRVSHRNYIPWAPEGWMPP